MAKIKTLVEKLNGGYESAFENLDERVEALGDIEIKDVNDTVHPEGSTLEKSDVAYIERIVIYREREDNIKGKPWMPTLDTDLMEFSKLSQAEYMVDSAIETAYCEGKKTIRDFIALPYGWYKDFTPVKKRWEKTKKHFWKYGFKLYKKGNVIED